MKISFKILFFFLVSFASMDCSSLFATEESVYYLHGFMRRSASMKKMARRFEKNGYETYLWDYPSRERTIDEHAQALVQDLNKTAKQSPGKPIHFVTHSLGGIILRAAVNLIDCPQEAKIGKAVLLSPPNQGSSFGRFLHKIGPMRKFLGPKAGKQLLTSQSFTELGAFPESMDIMIISGTFGWNPTIKGKNDGKVSVSESCLETPHKHMTIFSGHSWIMFSKSAIDNAFFFISQERK